LYVTAPLYARDVHPDAAGPASAGLFNGEALTLWRLQRHAAWIRCFVAEWPSGFWLGVECAGGELLSSETLATIEDVLSRSTGARSTFEREGWRED
jgi:hypothetical protein